MGEEFYIFKANALAPAETKTIDYTGPHPSKLLSMVGLIMQEALKVKSTSFFEDHFKWDISGDPIDFFGIWRCKDGKDERSTIWLKIRAHGRQSVKDKTGTIKIWIQSYVIVKIPYNNSLEKSLAWLHFRTFYYNQMRKYMKDAKRAAEEAENAIRTALGMVPMVERWE